MSRLWSCVLTSITLVFFGLSGMAEAPRAGLMWNKTGLPLVFPLQIKTRDGQDYFLTLIDAASGRPALGAYIEGGRFFKVLVPPGDYRLRLAAGTEWQGETALFGQATESIDLDEPLSFRVLDHSTKAGHIVDLTQTDAAGDVQPTVSARFRCNRRYVAEFPHLQPPFDDETGSASRVQKSGEVARHPDAVFDPERLSGREEPARPTDYAPYLSSPRSDIRTRPC